MSAANTTSRRRFLSDVGCGVLVGAVGATLASELGLSPALAGEPEKALTFGNLEPLVVLMQETPVSRLLPVLTEKLQSGVELRTLVAAAALANARTFGGEDYVGFHTLMAIAPAWHMSRELPSAQAALPVFKVLYRNTNRIAEHGGRASEVLHPVAAASGTQNAQTLNAAIHSKDVKKADATFAALTAISKDEAFNALLQTVGETTEVHRVVLPYRAWDLLDIIGQEQAQTLLRQSVHYCVKAESWGHNGEWDAPRTLLPKLLEEHHLLGKTPGTREVDDAWVEAMSKTIFNSTPAQAAAAVAAALEEGFAPAALGEALSLAANQLILRDIGRTFRDETTNKPIGSVHGDSIGVHACDSANAWRNMSRVSNSRNTFACLILGAYQVAFDRVNRGGDFLNWQPLPLQRHVDDLKTDDPKMLLAELKTAVEGNLQARASAITARFGRAGHDSRPIFDMMLKYAISEDGSLHAEKYYRTVSEEFTNTRAAFRWRQLIALARVTASEYGRPAPGYAEAKALMKA
jgi:hypothetical protein